MTYDDNRKLTVVNLFAGPGAGKSVLAADLYSLAKKNQLKVELVHEVAKDFVWEKWSHIFGEQDFIFAHQHRLIRRLVYHDIDYCIVDSSILLALFYRPEWFPESFDKFVVDVFSSYDNFNVFVKRNPALPYQQWGRNETLEQAEAIDKRVQDYFDQRGIPYITVTAGDGADKQVFDALIQHKHK